MEEEAVAQGEQLRLGHLLDLVGGVAGLDVRPEGPSLDRLGQDGGRRADVFGGRLVGRVQLAVVVSAAGEGLQLLVGQVGDEGGEAGVGAEEVLADVGPGLGGVLLELAVDRRVHLVEEHAVDVLGQQVVPRPAPDDLDDVPPRPAEEGFELLDDLAVAPHRAVEALQVAVDHEGQVVEVLAPGDAQAADRLRLVELAVADEAPHPAAGGVDDAPGVQVTADVGLADGVDGPEAHRHRGVLPELGHEPGVGIGGKPAVAHLEPEVVEVPLGQPALDEGPGVDAGRGVALEVDLVPGAAAVLAAEEVVEPDLVEGGGAGVGGEMAADRLRLDVGPDHHHGGVPPDVGPDAALEVLVAGELRLLVGRDGVDIRRGHRGREADVGVAGPLQEAEEEVAGTGLAVDGHDVVERVEPLPRLGGVDVRELVADTVEEHDIPWCHRSVPNQRHRATWTAGQETGGSARGGTAGDGSGMLSQWMLRLRTLSGRRSSTRTARAWATPGPGDGRGPCPTAPRTAAGSPRPPTSAWRSPRWSAPCEGITGPVHVISDSTYVVNCFRQRWWEGWQRRGWRNSQGKPVANRDLWESTALPGPRRRALRHLRLGPGPLRRSHERARGPVGDQAAAGQVR